MSAGIGKHMKDWMLDAAVQARNFAPFPLALVGDSAGWFTLDNISKVLLALYGALQIGYLVWKWHKEARDARK